MQNNSVNRGMFFFLAPEFGRPCRYTGVMKYPSGYFTTTNEFFIRAFFLFRKYESSLFYFNGN